MVDERREPRACKGCGHVRTVLVREVRRFVGDGTYRDSHGVRVENGEFRVTGESYEQHCGACKAARRAVYYLGLAEEWQRRANALYDRQARAAAKKASKP